ncbi:MAG: MFS transporter [Anaerolineales bacterium]
MSRDLILVAFALMTWGVGEGMFLFFEPLYLQEMGASPLEIGAILGGVGIAMTIAYLPAGYLSDRFGRRPMLVSAWILGTTATWVMALSRTLPIFVLGIGLYGFTSFVVVPLNSYVTAARGKWSVARAITFISAAFNFGAILGPLLGGWIGEQVGLHFSFLAAAFIFLLSTSIIIFIRPQPVEISSFERGRFGFGGLLNERFMRYLVVIFIVMFAMYLPQPLSQNFLQNERGISLFQIGQLISARSAGIVILNLTLGQLNARIGFIIAQAAMAMFTLLIWHGASFYNYALGYLLLGSYQTARSLAVAQGRALTQASNMGIAYGMIETVMSLAIILAPPLAGYLYIQNPVWIY